MGTNQKILFALLVKKTLINLFFVIFKFSGLSLEQNECLVNFLKCENNYVNKLFELIKKRNKVKTNTFVNPLDTDYNTTNTQEAK